MKSERLTYRLRTTELIRQVLQMSKGDQMKFYGMEDDGHLETELMRASKRINTNREIDWRIFDLIASESGKVVGNCGYHTWWLDHNKAEIGYWLNERSRGKGYMTEAIKTVIKYGFDEMGFATIEADHFIDNPASGRVLEKVGFEKLGRLEDVHCSSRDNQPGWHYRLTRERLIT